MKIYTNKNNTSTLKLLITAKLAGINVEVIEANFDDKIFSGPRQLPILIDGKDYFFSSNAAVQHLFPAVDSSSYRECLQLLEWEATRLSPLVSTALLGKATSDLKQALSALVQVIDARLAKHPYVMGEQLSPADVTIFATLYPLVYRDDLRTQYLSETSRIITWAELINTDDVKEAVKQWGGSLEGPFGATSALGIPQLNSVATPVGSPEEAESGPSAEEVSAAKEAWENGLGRLPAPIKQEKVVLPVKGRKNVLITSALPYVNNVPHLGNIIGCVLSADIFARYCRICDYNTLFICGTDEYGTATETKALEENLSPKQICDKYFEIHNSVYRWFNIGFDYFGRTSTPEQTEITQKMFLKLKDNGFISSQTVDQLLCQKCDRFLADRFVEGTCPHPGCLYDSARGDQCDKCGKLINAIELIAPRCKVCSNTPVVRPSEQLFIELGLIEPSLRAWLSTGIERWSAPARAVTRSWLREPLRARAVTRDLKWGVPVPVPGYQSKVFYVWFDAPIGYMSITQAATKNYEQWWKPDKEHNVQLYQFMAKDNVPFHAIMFPAALLGVNEGHTTVNYLYATEYLNYEEGKFSKSRGVGVFGTDAQDTGIPADVWRFYLASIRPETSDSSFSWTELGTRNNSELLNNLGNFCHRSLSFCASAFKGRVPDVMLTDTDLQLFALVNRDVIAYVQYMEKGRLRDALRQVMSISKRGNQHMQSEQPWVLLKGSDTDKVRGATAIGVCCQLVALTCALLQPYMPQTCRKLRAQLNVDEHALRINPTAPSLLKYLPPGHVIGKPEPLFTKIEQATLDELRAKYAGTQSDRANKEKSEVSIAELEKAITQQGEKVRQLKSTTKDKSVWQPEVDKLLALKKQLATAQTQAKPPAGAQSVESLEKSIAEQGEKVRQLKSTTKDKSVWQPEVDKLLALKKQLATAQTQAKPPAGAQSAEALEKAVAEQGEKVRQLKSTTKDKSVWQPEVDKLLALKKQLATAQTQAKPPAGDSKEELEKAIAIQGEKVRQLKASTKDKTVWQPEVTILLDLKKKLSAL